MLVPFPIAGFVGAFVTDIVYWRTSDPLWASFSGWLLVAGLAMAALAAIAGLIDFLGSAQIRALRPAWIHLIGNVTAVVLSLINAFVHCRAGYEAGRYEAARYEAIVPTGLILSGLVVAILLVTGWMSWEMVYRNRVGIAD